MCPGELTRITLGQQEEEEETSAMPIGGSSSEGGVGESCWEKMKERIKAKRNKRGGTGKESSLFDCAVTMHQRWLSFWVHFFKDFCQYDFPKKKSCKKA